MGTTLISNSYWYDRGQGSGASGTTYFFIKETRLSASVAGEGYPAAKVHFTIIPAAQLRSQHLVVFGIDYVIYIVSLLCYINLQHFSRAVRKSEAARVEWPFCSIHHLKRRWFNNWAINDHLTKGINSIIEHQVQSALCLFQGVDRRKEWISVSLQCCFLIMDPLLSIMEFTYVK